MSQFDEPHWLPEDRDKAIAWMRDQRERCPECKQRPSDGYDEKKHPIYPLPMKAETWVCPFCADLAREREGLDKAAEHDARQRWGKFQVLVPNPTAARREG